MLLPSTGLCLQVLWGYHGWSHAQSHSKRPSHQLDLQPCSREATTTPMPDSTPLLCLSKDLLHHFINKMTTLKIETPRNARPHISWSQISWSPRKGKKAWPQFRSITNSYFTHINRATTTTKLGLQNAELGSVINSFLSSATAKLVISWPVLRHIFAVVTL
jgi:hypothetical protein